KRGGGEIVDGWPEAGKPQKIGFDGCHSGLLQHHLAEPDPIGIGLYPARAIARRNTPWQVPGILVVPAQNSVGVDRFDCGEIHAAGHSTGLPLVARERERYFDGMAEKESTPNFKRRNKTL